VGQNPGSMGIVPDDYLDYRASIYVTNFNDDRALVYLKNLGDNITSIVSDANNLTSQAYATNITV